jgi:hypothetical protein
MTLLSRALVAVVILISSCARVHVRREALEQLAATIAAGVASDAGRGRSGAHPCPSNTPASH